MHKTCGGSASLYSKEEIKAIYRKQRVVIGCMVVLAVFLGILLLQGATKSITSVRSVFFIMYFWGFFTLVTVPLLIWNAHRYLKYLDAAERYELKRLRREEENKKQKNVCSDDVEVCVSEEGDDNSVFQNKPDTEELNKREKETFGEEKFPIELFLRGFGEVEEKKDFVDDAEISASLGENTASRQNSGYQGKLSCSDIEGILEDEARLNVNR